MRSALTAAFAFALAALPFGAAGAFTVERSALADQKAVFATVESPNVVPGPRAHRRHGRQPGGAARATRVNPAR